MEFEGKIVDRKVLVENLPLDELTKNVKYISPKFAMLLTLI